MTRRILRVEYEIDSSELFCCECRYRNGGWRELFHAALDYGSDPHDDRIRFRDHECTGAEIEEAGR